MTKSNPRAEIEDRLTQLEERAERLERAGLEMLNEAMSGDFCKPCENGDHDDHREPCECRLYVCTGAEFNPYNLQDRRWLITGMVSTDIVSTLHSDLGESAVDMMIQALAIELFKTSADLLELKETVELGLKVLGAQTAGLTGRPLGSGLHLADPEALEPGPDRMVASLYQQARAAVAR